MNDSTLIRVMIVDDHELIRHGLGLALETFDDLQLVAEATDGLEALQLCQRHQPDVILMDLVMPGLDGVVTTAMIRQHFQQTKIVILTSFNDVDMVEAAMQAGANGHLLKNVSIDKLAQTIREVHLNGHIRTHGGKDGYKEKRVINT
jgi:DNA-binding NarL/FixJ family response regulator